MQSDASSRVNQVLVLISSMKVDEVHWCIDVLFVPAKVVPHASASVRLITAYNWSEAPLHEKVNCERGSVHAILNNQLKILGIESVRLKMRENKYW